MHVKILVPAIVVVLGGCMDPSGDGSGPHLLRAFEATYDLGDGTLVISLEAPVSVRTADLGTREAYVFRAVLSGDFLFGWQPDPLVQEMALDGDLRVARVFVPCVSTPCPDPAMDWRVQGSLPPIAVGLGSGTHKYSADGLPTILKGGSIVDVPREASSMAMFIVRAEGRQTFGSDALLPERAELMSDLYGVRIATLVDVTWGDPLPAIATWPDLPLATRPEPRSARAVPDAEWDALDRGYTLGYTFEVLRQQSPEVDAILSGKGCVIGYDAQRPLAKFTPAVGGAVYQDIRSTTSWYLFEPRDVQRRWDVQATHLLGQIIQWEVVEQGGPPFLERTRPDWCAHLEEHLMERAFAPAAVVAGAGALQEALALDSEGNLSVFSLHRTQGPAMQGREVTFGAERYVVIWTPANPQRPLPYSMDMRAATGMWETATLGDATTRIDSDW